MTLALRHRRVALVLLALSLTAASVPSGKPEDVGFSSDRLQRINELVAQGINIAGIAQILHLEHRTSELESDNSDLKSENARLRSEEPTTRRRRGNR